MRQNGSLSHSRWECKYRVVFIPKSRKKAIICQIRRHRVDVMHPLSCVEGGSGQPPAQGSRRAVHGDRRIFNGLLACSDRELLKSREIEPCEGPPR